MPKVDLKDVRFAYQQLYPEAEEWEFFLDALLDIAFNDARKDCEPPRRTRTPTIPDAANPPVKRKRGRPRKASQPEAEFSATPATEA